MSDRTLGLHVRARSGPGILHRLSGVIARHQGDITSVEIVERTPEESRVYFEVDLPVTADALVGELRGLDVVLSLDVVETFQRVYGKRVIIMGGGAQVGQVAIGAISEADRHNIRGERISVDTIPLVGERTLALAVDAVARLPRASILVLAGSIMGGEISKAVDRVREAGIPVIALKMAGTVPEHADLVVTDPIQAGVFAVMHISSKAVFDINRVRGREF
jgi:energy-converting hydrogenase B subunit Q